MTAEVSFAIPADELARDLQAIAATLTEGETITDRVGMNAADNLRGVPPSLR